MTNGPTPCFAFTTPADAVAAMLERIGHLDAEPVPLSDAFGRILADPARTDRPSPACDVSAMDGYAVREIEVARTIPVVGELLPGHAPCELPPNSALRIFTGGPVPAGCAAVIPRENVTEQPDAIRLPDQLIIKPGQHIRRCGENAPAGEVIVDRGTTLGPQVIAALAACGVVAPRVFRRVRVRCIVTGDEVLEITSPVEPWQLRDSNGSTLAAMFAACRWIDWCGAARVADDRHRLHQTVAAALATSDAVLLTGGVSMGDYDYVPTVLFELGCHIVFHRLPIRPGKPILGAIGPNGQVVLGLPGNPVSVATTARRFALPALRRLAGAAVPDKPVPLVAIANPKDDPLGLHWFRPVRLLADGQAELLITRGSGDIINTARSDGFVAYPPRQSGSGPWPYYIWSVSDE